MVDWIIGGEIYDVAAGAYQRRDIEIADGRIKALADSARPGPDDHVVDVDGAYLLPGLIDCHVHLCLPTEEADPSNPWRDSLPGAIALYAAQAARRTLLGGITTAR
ncbi:MAG: amidohydrolase family protein, partial [Pseudomonadota bacterium]|nr:amidohydrolase family protein [Pseudomonadota bacterium]